MMPGSDPHRVGIPEAVMPARVPSPLSPARRRLLDLCRRVRDGRLAYLHVRGGQPLFDPPPVAVARVPLADHRDGGHSAGPSDPAPTAADRALLALLDRVGDGVVHEIVVRAGRPVVAEHAV